MAVDISDWLKPIREDAPCGDDVSFSDTFDQIRDARRSDDPNLPQGDWKRELKVSNWRQVLELAGVVLAKQSKDLQAAVWMGEALIAHHHQAGAEAAFDLLAGLQQDYWDGMYPLLEDGDLEERSAKLAWFNTYGAQALLALHVTPGPQGYTLADWQVSRDVDNLARQDADAHREALDEGKPSGEMFDRAIESHPDAVLVQQCESAKRVLDAFHRFKAVTDERMGLEGPSLAALETALTRLNQVFTKAAEAKGLLDAASAGEAEGANADGGEGWSVPVAPAAAAATSGGFSLGAGDAASKAAAVKALGEISAWFKRVEPHSPVAFLLERAVAWADTPLDEWLAEVISDDSTLRNIRSKIGLPD